jgi:hypothetical protein
LVLYFNIGFGIGVGFGFGFSFSFGFGFGFGFVFGFVFFFFLSFLSSFISLIATYMQSELSCPDAIAMWKTHWPEKQEVPYINFATGSVLKTFVFFFCSFPLRHLHANI